MTLENVVLSLAMAVGTVIAVVCAVILLQAGWALLAGAGRALGHSLGRLSLMNAERRRQREVFQAERLVASHEEKVRRHAHEERENWRGLWSRLMEPSAEVAAGRPDWELIRRSRAAARSRDVVRVCADLAGACWLFHVSAAEFAGLDHLGTLRTDPECTRQRVEMQELLRLATQRLSVERHSDSRSAKTFAVMANLPRGCGPDDCILLNCNFNESERPCATARVLGFRPGEENSARP